MINKSVQCLWWLLGFAVFVVARFRIPVLIPYRVIRFGGRLPWFTNRWAFGWWYREAPTVLKMPFKVEVIDLIAKKLDTIQWREVDNLLYNFVGKPIT